MAGIYVHIPFCKQACHYCNFHFSTALGSKDVLLSAIERELEHRKAYLEGRSIGSIYFGGGTPSLVEPSSIRSLLSTIEDHFSMDSDIEVTLEANPDDMKLDALQGWKAAGINRLSVGIQSFREQDLLFMNRAHTAQEAREALLNAQRSGFDNMSVDLIYGSPTTDHKHWQNNLAILIAEDVPHLSCYALTVEPQTALHHQIATKKIAALDEAHAAVQFEMLQVFAETHGYLHYEISNLAKPGFEAKHNTNYWSGKWYLGVGPSAHSFNGHSRSWNVAHNHKYVDALEHGILPLETEHLSPRDRYNEYVMTHLRTSVGCNILELERMGEEFASHFRSSSTPYVESGQMQMLEGNYVLEAKDRLFCDRISADLFLA